MASIISIIFLLTVVHSSGVHAARYSSYSLHRKQYQTYGDDQYSPSAGPGKSDNLAMQIVFGILAGIFVLSFLALFIKLLRRRRRAKRNSAGLRPYILSARHPELQAGGVEKKGNWGGSIFAGFRKSETSLDKPSGRDRRESGFSGGASETGAPQGRRGDSDNPWAPNNRNSTISVSSRGPLISRSRELVVEAEETGLPVYERTDSRPVSIESAFGRDPTQVGDAGLRTPDSVYFGERVAGVSGTGFVQPVPARVQEVGFVTVGNPPPYTSN
ncbi:hypothetical protein RUND412_002300 [Rhizina undulata]